jgi:hydroxypyruvate isomerase
MKMSRRTALNRVAGTAVLAAAAVPSAMNLQAADAPAKLKGNIRHSVSKWCYGKIPLDDFCKAVKEMGIESVELLGESEWATVKKHGLTCAMCNGPDSIGYGWNRVEHHEKLLAGFEQAIPKVAENGFPNIITFSGNRVGKGYKVDDEEGLKNCVAGLKKLAPIAEKHKVTVIVELLNSKVNHKDYMADHTAWGVELCKQVGSERVKLLYDIYHMQIMEGDVIRTIKDSSKYLGHYHTGGNPGRNEIDDTQELYYPAIMKAIVATGYKGFVGQEFVPKRDPLASLRQSIEICDV